MQNPKGNRVQDELSERQKTVLSFVDGYCRSKGRSPALREIGDAVGSTSSSYTWYLVDQLVHWGYLGRTSSTRRFLFVTKQGYEAIGKQPEDKLNATLNHLRDENKRLRAWCEQLHRERDDLKDQLQGLMALAS